MVKRLIHYQIAQYNGGIFSELIKICTYFPVSTKYSDVSIENITCIKCLKNLEQDKMNSIFISDISNRIKFLTKRNLYIKDFKKIINE